MNLPNSLTLGRIVLVPLLVVVLLTNIEVPFIFGVPREILAALIFTVASISDWLDGYLARRRRQVTTLGQLLDPIADKLLITAALVSLVQMDLAPAWMVAVVIGRELLVTGLRSLALTRTTEIVPLASAVAPEYLVHLAASAALANQNFLREAPATAATPLEDLETFAKSVQPGPSHLYTLAVTRMSADPDAPVYLDRPNVLSRHAFLGLQGGRIVRLEGTDIVV